MKKINKVILTVLILINAFACAQQTPNQTNMKQKIVKSEEQWKKDLSKEEYEILRKKGTERAFTGEFWDHHEKGVYVCAACQMELFNSDTKYESGSGWPSFFKSHEAESYLGKNLVGSKSSICSVMPLLGKVRLFKNV